ncbi:MAG: hypothetical protein ACT4O4_02975 [Nitrospiraceae bacterium]
MKLLETRIERRSRTVRLVGVIEEERSARNAELVFEYPAEYADFVVDSADPFVAALFVPCLTTGEDLDVIPPVSPRLLGNLPRVQEILRNWYPELRSVNVIAHERLDDPARLGTGVGAMFSGGVDSFYTALKSLGGWSSGTPRVSHLLFIKKIGTRVELPKRAEEAGQHLQAVAKRIGLPLIIGETNIRQHFDHVNYAALYQGAVLAATGLSLSGGLRYVFVPSTYSYAQLKPLGSHPLLDPLWSTELVEVIHDGAEKTRTDKLACIARWDPLALRSLRVCVENLGGSHNCGRCGKCARTMLTLDLLGLLPQATTFPPRSRRELVAALEQDRELYLKEVVDLASRTQENPGLSRLLEGLSRQLRFRRSLHSLIEDNPLVAIRPWLLCIFASTSERPPGPRISAKNYQESKA